MKARRIFTLFLAACMLLTLASCDSSKNSDSAAPADTTATTDAVAPAASAAAGQDLANEKTYEITLCVQDNAADPRVSVAAEAEARWIFEQSDGRISVTIVPGSGAVTSSADIYDSTRTGIIEMGQQNMSKVSGRFPLIEVLLLPGQSSYPACTQIGLTARALYEKYPEIQNEFSDVKLLSFNAVPGGLMLSTKTPVQTLEDLKGKIVRTGGVYSTAAVKALGASPITLSASEYADGAVKGIYDIQVGGFLSTHAFGMDGLFKYVTAYDLLPTFFIQSLNLDFYNSLPDDLKAVFDFGSWESDCLVYGGVGDSSELELKTSYEQWLSDNNLPGVYTLTSAEKAKWDTAIQGVRQIWIDDNSKNFDSVLVKKIYADAQTFGEQYAYGVYQNNWEKIRDEWLAYPAIS